MAPSTERRHGGRGSRGWRGWRPWRSLLGKSLIAALAPFVVVLVVVAVGGLLAVDRVAEEVVKRRDSELARVTAGCLADRLAALPEPLEELAGAPQLRDGGAGSIRSLLAGARGGQLQSFDIGLLAYDAEGVVVATDPPWLALLPQWLQFPDRSQLRVVAGERRAALSSVFRDPFTGVDFIVVAVPVLVRGELAAVLAGGISLDAPLLAAVAELRTGSSGSAFLVDEGGRVIYHRDPALVGQPLTELASVRAAVDGQTGAAVGPGSQGEKTISGFAPVVGTGWGVVTEESWDEVVAPIRRTGRIALLVLALGGALSGMLLWVVVRRMLRPLERLAEGADRIAAGDLAHRVDTDTDEELAALGGRFNAMADALADSYASLERRVEERTAENRRLYEEAAQRGEELRELNQRALAVADVAQQIGSLTRLDALLPAVGERLREAFGYTAVEVYLADDESGDLVAGSPRRPGRGGRAARAAALRARRGRGGTRGGGRRVRGDRRSTRGARRRDDTRRRLAQRAGRPDRRGRAGGRRARHPQPAARRLRRRRPLHRRDLRGSARCRDRERAALRAEPGPRGAGGAQPLRARDPRHARAGADRDRAADGGDGGRAGGRPRGGARPPQPRARPGARVPAGRAPLGVEPAARAHGGELAGRGARPRARALPRERTGGGAARRLRPAARAQAATRRRRCCASGRRR